jgi:8-hydroxy-5-deazaflavin:NADPH oxidoreductase
MILTIVGSGNVGRALGNGWRTVGHSVTFAMREPGSAKAAALKQDGFGVVPLNAAAAQVGVIVMAVPWIAVAATLRALGPLDGKILVDTTDALTPDTNLAIGFNDSAGETVARGAPGARVVKAFSTTGAGNMSNARSFATRPMMPIAGDDAEAKEIVRKLAEELGFEAIDVGPLTMSRYLEPLAVLWIKLAYTQGVGTDFAFTMIRR